LNRAEAEAGNLPPESGEPYPDLVARLAHIQSACPGGSADRCRAARRPRRSVRGTLSITWVNGTRLSSDFWPPLPRRG
jgi:hypothetical protein